MQLILDIKHDNDLSEKLSATASHISELPLMMKQTRLQVKSRLSPHLIQRLRLLYSRQMKSCLSLVKQRDLHRNN